VPAQEGPGTSVARLLARFQTFQEGPWKQTKGQTMRFGKWQGLPLWFSLSTALGLTLGLVSSAQADGGTFPHTIPRVVPAYNFTTGGQYFAPPVPYGHYAKDYVADLQKATGCVTCQLHSLFGGTGGGHSFFHKGHGDGVDDGAGYGHGHHGFVADDGAGLGYSGAIGHGGAGFATTGPLSTSQAMPLPSSQSICGQPGCNVGGRHSHLGNLLHKGRCGNCGGAGCGSCGGTATGCPLCGGRGCANCLGGMNSGHGGLGSLLHGKLASIGGVFGGQRMSWFLGAGGPVPLTPGYVPYIVTTRSPRDYFSFAPMNPNAP
jgi:hypothetical protein